MNWWELLLIFAVVMLLLAGRYRFDLQLMAADKKTLLAVVGFIAVLYIGYTLLVESLR